jgi:hypothetical protein
MIILAPQDAPLREFNPHHDQHGRFTGGSGGGSVTQHVIAQDKAFRQQARTAARTAPNKYGISNANTSGQGHDASHVMHPLHPVITNHGYTYSHTTPVHHGAGVTNHHTYKKGEHNVGVRHGSDSWSTSTSTASGRQTVGKGEVALEAHLARKDRRYARSWAKPAPRRPAWTRSPE